MRIAASGGELTDAGRERAEHPESKDLPTRTIRMTERDGSIVTALVGPVVPGGPEKVLSKLRIDFPPAPARE